ncbi:MAG TPA: hypothetical protein PK778_09170 [Bacillota bacterium]|mgnify:CR=1 FL=1|nr:hypothetical protein [Clostridiales bacterium]HPT86146.1 hypothetical protein [Bacillota bacterium]
MRYVPPKKNNSAAVLSGILIFSAAVCLLLSGAPFMPRGILQIFFIAFAVAGIQITQRFVLTYYEYELLTREMSAGLEPAGGDSVAVSMDGDEPFDGRYDFSVIRVQGERRKTVCCLSCTTLVGVYAGDKKSREEAEKKYGKPNLVYNFKRNLFDAREVCALFEFNGKLVEIRLECSESFEGMLRSRIRGSSPPPEERL